jgi:SEC-C motif-containing protein
MRSRYSAYYLGLGDYLWQTHHSDFRDGLTVQMLSQPQPHWQKLEIILSCILSDGDHGLVEFKAWYRENERLELLHERSEFVRQQGRWLYTQGKFKPAPIGRNAACICQSGKKYKQCCGRR